VPNAGANGSKVDAYEYDYSYGGLDGKDAYSYLDDDANYYGSDDDSFYDEYGFYADDDALGYGSYYDDYFDYGGSSNASAAGSLCVVHAGGRVALPNGTASCDIRVAGVDGQADKLPGGLDGVYKLVGCHAGRPMYKRQGSPAGQERVLYYSKAYADWDISNGSAPSEDILLYGTDIHQHAVPLFGVAWQLGGDLSSAANASSDESYVPAAGARLACADGSAAKPPPRGAAQRKVGPVLTPDEIEAKYKMLFEKYGRRSEPNPTLNLSFVVMLVMLGLTTVLAIPYCLMRQRSRARGYAPVSTTNGAGSSFAAVIQQSKKRQSGHVH
jgi:iron-regulated transporter 1